MNLERAIKNLDKKYEFIAGDNSTVIYHSNYDDDDLIPGPLTKERKAIGQELEQEQELIDHLGEYHNNNKRSWRTNLNILTISMRI